MPIRWMSPEAIVDGKYSIKSDVWAFGVVLWEIFSFGTTPYSKLGHIQVIEKIIQGYRLETPTGCPIEIETLMQQCWNTEPDIRPDFKAALACLSKFNADRVRIQAAFDVSTLERLHQMKQAEPLNQLHDEAGSQHKSSDLDQRDANTNHITTGTTSSGNSSGHAYANVEMSHPKAEETPALCKASDYFACSNTTAHLLDEAAPRKASLQQPGATSRTTNTSTAADAYINNAVMSDQPQPLAPSSSHYVNCIPEIVTQAVAPAAAPTSDADSSTGSEPPHLNSGGVQCAETQRAVAADSSYINVALPQDKVCCTYVCVSVCLCFVVRHSNI